MFVQGQGFLGNMGWFNNPKNAGPFAKSADESQSKLLQAFSQGLRGPGTKNSAYSLSNSLVEKMMSAPPSDPVSTPEKTTAAQVPKLTEPSVVDWTYLQQRVVEGTQKTVSLASSPAPEGEGGESADSNDEAGEATA